MMDQTWQDEISCNSKILC